MRNRDIDNSVSTKNSTWSNILVNFNRWNRKTIRNPKPFMLEIIHAVFSLVLLSAVFGDVGNYALNQAGYGNINYVTFILPGVLFQATIGSAFNSGVGIVNEIKSGMFEKTVVTPMSSKAVFGGKAGSKLFSIVVQVLIVLSLGILLGANIQTGFAGIAGAVVVCLLVGLLFMSISNIMALRTKDEETLNSSSMLFIFPLLFLSPAFIPISSDIKLIATLNPVTYGVDAVRSLMLGEDVMTVLTVTQFDGMMNTLVPSLGVLIGMNILCGSIAIWLLAKASSASGE